MKNQVLTIEQMKELEALGIDTSKATIYWTRYICSFPHPETGEWCDNFGGQYHLELIKPHFEKYADAIPTFTLFDIFSILPEGWELVKEESETDRIPQTYFLFIDLIVDKHSERSGSILECAFEMLKWVKQNGYI